MDTLVLDIAYRPIGRVSWQRAITLLFEEKVDVVESYDQWKIHSVNLEFQVPSVVRWRRGNFLRKKALRFSKDNVYLRDNGKCQYCGQIVPREEVTYDHVVPKARGGKTFWDNIVIACEPCNQKKGPRTPSEAKMILQSIPIRPKTLGNGMHLPLVWHHSMPEAWRQWLSTQVISNYYWSTCLKTG